MTVTADTVPLNISFKGLLLMVLSINDEKVASSGQPNLRLEYKMAKLDTSFMKMTEKPYPLGPIMEVRWPHG